jgi:hypothetical protein
MLLGLAYPPLFGKPVDPRLLAAFRLMMGTFDKAMATGKHPARRDPGTAVRIASQQGY